MNYIQSTVAKIKSGGHMKEYVGTTFLIRIAELFQMMWRIINRKNERRAV